MLIFHYRTGQPVRLIKHTEPLPADGLVWADLLRDDADDWEQWAEPWLGVTIDPQHVKDSLNALHPSFFDGTPEYDMLVFQGLGAKDEAFPLDTRTATFFLFDRVLVTVRSTENISIDLVRQKLMDGRLKPPGTVLKMAHAILDHMVDRYLRIREPMERRLTRLQDELLDPNHPQNDWRELLVGRRVVRQLECMFDEQLEALDGWRRGSRTDWTGAEEVRIRDLGEHIRRLRDHAAGQERDLESAVQLHFAAVSHRTNRVIRGLTVMSAIFFPLTLITGIYGMNFEHMPELHTRYGYFIVLGAIITIGIGMVIYFRRRGFL